MSRPLLVTVAHGTRTPAGNEVARLLTDAAAARLGWPAVTSYVELCEPSFADVVAAADRPVVVVPLLLSTGHHVRHDLPAATAGHVVSTAPPLGPHRLLGAALALRLREAGARPRTPAVLVAAGSRDPDALRDLGLAARGLSTCWGAPVRLATLGGLGQRPAAVVRPGDVVAPYLLAPGHFADRCRAESLAAGASAVAAPIGVAAPVVELIVRRARQPRSSSTCSGVWSRTMNRPA